MRSSPSQESWPGSNPVGLQETELMPSDVQLDRTANIRAILGLLKAGPRTDRDIELSCFLSRYTRVKYMRALECAGIVEVLSKSPLHDYRLLEVLGIGQDEKDQVQAVQRQLEVLEMHGLLSKGPRGWQWLKK